MTNDPEMFMTYSMLEAILRSARKQAWDEGYEEARANMYPDAPGGVNPYHDSFAWKEGA